MFSFLIGLADIFLIYFIYYRVLLLFAGSRTNKVIWGLLGLAVITVIAQIMNLTATAWIMQKLWVAGTLAVVIVFQPEIRRGLMTFGTGFSKLGMAANPLGRIRAMASSDYSFVPAMIEAIRTASEERTGMLIVLEQDQGLKDIIAEGTPIDAIVTKELLLTIFFDKTLLHDGAVLISNNRIELAAGVLPLTEQKELSKVLGTRHRAALGLSENSDAIIIVVSEETGTISMARNGVLQRLQSISGLEARLNDLYRARSKKTLLEKPVNPKQILSYFSSQQEKDASDEADCRGKYKQPVNLKYILKDFFLNPPEIFKNNWRLKLLSFSLSIITYIYVKGL